MTKQFIVQSGNVRSRDVLATIKRVDHIFPCACCGDTCSLLGHFFIEHDISTWRVEGIAYRQTHAWLSTSGTQISDGWFIDITGDQFKTKNKFMNYNKSVYVDRTDDFHKMFEIKAILRSEKIIDLPSTVKSRLSHLYEDITRCIDE